VDRANPESHSRESQPATNRSLPHEAAGFEILESQKLVDGEADITLVPAGNEFMKQLIASEQGPVSPAPGKKLKTPGA